MTTHPKTSVTKATIDMHDTADELAIKFVRDLQQTLFGGKNLDEHELLDTAKSILEAATPIIERATGKHVPAIDTNY